MMKKTIGLLGAVCIAALFTGCANINEMNTGSASGSSSAQSTQTVQAQSSGTSTTASSGGQAQESTAAAGQTSDAQSQNADISSAGSTDAGSTDTVNTDAGNASSADETYDAQNQNGDVAENYNDWEGTYVSDSGETLSIVENEDGTISFSFAVCGISGTAAADGNTAQYNGDDENVVCFALSEDYVTVSVTNTDGNPTDGAVMAGTYQVQ